MPNLSAPHHESTTATQEEFLAILCGDEDLLRAEFEAIIAAEWPSRPPRTPADDAPVDHSPDPAGPRPSGGQARLPNRARHPDIDPGTRERSPPPHNSRH